VERLKEEVQRVRSRLPADVQAALTVIGHRCSGHDADGKQLDLSGTNLSLANLEKLNWRRLTSQGLS
jgi:hypothetical protein